MANQAIQKISKLLRTPEDVLMELFDNMEKLTGKTGVAEKIYEENQAVIEQKLKDLGILKENPEAQYVEGEILKRTKLADDHFDKFLTESGYNDAVSSVRVINFLKTLDLGLEKGFFIKEDKLRSFLFLNPPKNILDVLGYKNVIELLANENIYHIFAALRFVENERWLNESFFHPYNDLIADNFEEREIKMEVLPKRWAEIGEKFVGKKLHHMSHLKEAGYIFVNPSKQNDYSGQLLEDFTLMMHYLHEVTFYSHLFKRYSILPNFGSSIVNLLTAKVSSAPLSKDVVSWRIIPRYLAKIDDSDPRLFEPHISPEALHWLRAERLIEKIAKANPQMNFNFWQGEDDCVGEVFFAGKRGEELVSFDLIDNIISLSKGGMMKYLYHQQEALWNKIFIEFMGEDKLEEVLIENMGKGYVSLIAGNKN